MEVGEFAFPIDPVENSFWGGFRGQGAKIALRVSLSRAQPRDLSCTAGISVYALRENDVLVLPHIIDERSAIKISRLRSK